MSGLERNCKQRTGGPAYGRKGGADTGPTFGHSVRRTELDEKIERQVRQERGKNTKHD